MKYTPEEREYIRKMYGRVPLSEMAEHLGRSEAAVESLITHNDDLDRRPDRIRHEWSPDLRHRLRCIIAADCPTPSEIAERAAQVRAERPPLPDPPEWDRHGNPHVAALRIAPLMPGGV